MKDFFGFDGYIRPAEGYLSWQHLTFVSCLMGIMVALAVWLGRKNRHASLTEKNRVLIPAAILIDVLQFAFVFLNCLLSDPDYWKNELPLFLCSIQFLTLPLAAFSRGRLQEAALDFVMVFGLLGAVLGTYFAGNNYSCYPVISYSNVTSGLTHSISGFASLYILISGMSSMKRKNLPICIAILLVFCLAAHIANVCLDYNYMFLVRGDGTPYDILYNLVSGHKVLYPMSVIVLFLVYIHLYYLFFHLFTRRKAR